MLDNDTEYFVEPRFAMSGGSWRDGGESSSLWRTRTSLGAEADWEIMPEDIIICKDPYGRDWQLGTGGFGSVRDAFPFSISHSWKGSHPALLLLLNFSIAYDRGSSRR